jgi:hypothetical protein
VTLAVERAPATLGRVGGEQGTSVFAPSVRTQEPRNIANSRAVASGKNTLRGCVSTRVRTPMRVKY